MAYGISGTNLASPILAAITGTSFVVSGLWAQLHTGDPGAAQTANLSAVTTRNQLTFAAPTVVSTNMQIALASTPAVWLMTTTETIAAISIWTASTAGSPLWDAQLTSPQNVINGDTFTLTACTLSLGSLSV